MSFLSSKGILKDLQKLYYAALKKENVSVAFKIKELLGRKVGLFDPKRKSVDKNTLSLDSLSDEDIARLIKNLKLSLTLRFKMVQFLIWRIDHD